MVVDRRLDTATWMDLVADQRLEPHICNKIAAAAGPVIN